VTAGQVLSVVVGLAGVYGIATLTRNVGGDAVCRPAVELAKKIAPLARGEVAAATEQRTLGRRGQPAGALSELGRTAAELLGMPA